MRLARPVALTVCAVAALLGPALPAHAAAPTKDNLASATVIGSLPTTITESVTMATVEPVDTAVNDQCGAPAVRQTV